MSTNIAQSNSLAVLAASIRQEHEATSAALKSSVQHAMAAGDLLLEARQVASAAANMAVSEAADISLSNSLPEAVGIVSGNTVVAAPAAADMAPDAMAVTEAADIVALDSAVAVSVVAEGATEFAAQVGRVSIDRPGRGPHRYDLRCADCGRHRGQLKDAAANLLRTLRAEGRLWLMPILRAGGIIT
jgi:hypothetical protein